MNAGEYSVRNNRVVFVAMAFVLVGGFVAFQKLGRLEDPEFTIKEARIITPYPGASPKKWPKRSPTRSKAPASSSANSIASNRSHAREVGRHRRDQGPVHKHTIPQVWDELRRKINDAQARLPPSVRGRSIVIDDFGDVYGVFLAISGEGFSHAELRRYAEFLRRELLVVPDVKKVDLFSEQQEVVFLEISRQRLAQLGINEDQIYSQLQAKNVVADGGRVRVGDEHVALASARRISPGRRHARYGDRLRQHGPPALPQGCRNARCAATRIRRGDCSGTTASRPSAWESPRYRAATS